MKHEVKKQIKRLRTERYGYGKIADLLHMPESTVKSFCRRKGLVGRAKAKQSMTATIMAGASVIAYIVGEGLVDAARGEGGETDE